MRKGYFYSLAIAAAGSLCAASTASAVTLDAGEAVVSTAGPLAFYVPINVIVGAGEAPFNLNSIDATFDFVSDLPAGTFKLLNVTHNPFPPSNFAPNPTPSNGSFLTTDLFLTTSSPMSAPLPVGINEVARINIELQPGASLQSYVINILNPEVSYNNANDSATPAVTPGSITVVPEPSTLGMLALAAFGLVRRRRA
jgi:hypothetical protein